MYTEIRFTLNGEQKLYQGDPLRRLLDVLREDYGLTGSKEGCGEGECGACSIIKNGELVTSCIIPVGAVNGCELLTIEGIRDTERASASSTPTPRAARCSAASASPAWSWQPTCC